MLEFSFPQISRLQDQIDTEDLYTGEGEEAEGDRSYGLEKEPHLTLQYGLHDEVSVEDVRRACTGLALDQLHLESPSSFTNDRFDVLKFDATGDGIVQINTMLSKLPHTTEYKFHPHVTIGYIFSVSLLLTFFFLDIASVSRLYHVGWSGKVIVHLAYVVLAQGTYDQERRKSISMYSKTKSTV